MLRACVYSGGASTSPAIAAAMGEVGYFHAP